MIILMNMGVDGNCEEFFTQNTSAKHAFISQKYARTHARTSALSKIFPGVIHPDPPFEVLERGMGRREEGAGMLSRPSRPRPRRDRDFIKLARDESRPRQTFKCPRPRRDRDV